jgi:hypothetical protein
MKVQYLKSKTVAEVSDKYGQMLIDAKRVIELKEEKGQRETKEEKKTKKKK